LIAVDWIVCVAEKQEILKDSAVVSVRRRRRQIGKSRRAIDQIALYRVIKIGEDH
jgi:hypothetical protein